jgi:phospho-N-acetylmuramoyl-pentapeptide-transferase
MLYWLFEDFFAHAERGLRLIGAGIVSFAIVILLGPRLIKFLVRRKIGDRPEFDHADLNELTRHKSATPTMGGSLIVIAIFVSVMLFGNLKNMYIDSALVALVWLGVLGGIDDWIKLRGAGKSGRVGLRTWEKLVFQIGLAVLLSSFVWRFGRTSYFVEETGMAVNPAHSFFLPFRSPAIGISFIVYVIIMVIVMTGSSNAVNLSDGMDGLAAGCMLEVALVMLVVSWIVGIERWAAYFNTPFVEASAEMTVVCAAILGSCLGFLWFNAAPAAVFMGDTGSLPLGGLIGYIAVVTRQELTLMIAGGVFVMEAVSVLMQVGYYKMTKGKDGSPGKRLFRIAPIHHHFHLGGWAETKVVIRFWILGIIFAALAIGTLKLR